MYKHGLKLWSTNTDFYYKEAINLYNKGLYDYIELYVVPETIDTLPKWKQLKIPFIIHNAHFMQGFNLADAEMKSRNFEIYNQTKRFADELNAQYIIFHGGTDGSIEETVKQLTAFNEPRALIENKPFIALPNQFGGKFCRGATLEEIKYVLESVKCGFCLDFGHAICAANSLCKQLLQKSISEENNHDFVYDYCRKFMQFEPQIYHVTDTNDITSPYDAHLHLGHGQLDFEKIFQMIPDKSYITFETVKNSKENLDDFIEDMKWLRDF